jgi:transcriptional regulator with XRE-family HTH domain
MEPTRHIARNYPELQAVLAALRRASGLSQKALAAAIGSYEANICRWQGGYSSRIGMNIMSLERLAVAFKCDLEIRLVPPQGVQGRYVARNSSEVRAAFAALRRSLGVGQETLARLVGSNVGNISRFERGRRTLSMNYSTLTRLVGALGAGLEIELIKRG